MSDLWSGKHRDSEYADWCVWLESGSTIKKGAGDRNGKVSRSQLMLEHTGQTENLF